MLQLSPRVPVQSFMVSTKITVTSIARCPPDPLRGDVQIEHVGGLQEPVSGEVSALPTLFVG